MVEKKPVNRCKCAVLGICGVIIATGLFVGIYPAYASNSSDAQIEKPAFSKDSLRLNAKDWKLVLKSN